MAAQQTQTELHSSSQRVPRPCPLDRSPLSFTLKHLTDTLGLGQRRKNLRPPLPRRVHGKSGKIRVLGRVGVNMAMTYACGRTTVDVGKVVDVVRSAGAAIMQVYTEDAKVDTGQLRC